MSIYPYKVFETIIEQGSFAKAAEALGVTPSSVSHTVSKLEDEMGFPLFIRNHGKVTLTDSGKQLLPSIFDYINTETKLDQACSEIAGLSKGKVRVGGFNSVTMAWMPSIIKEYQSLYPNIEIHVKQAGYTSILNDVNAGILDIGFITKATAPGRKMIEIYDDPLLCVAPSDFVPENKTFVTPEEIKRSTIILQGGGSEADTLEFMGSLGITASPHLQISDDSALVAMVEAGLGMAIMPSLLFGTKPENVNIYPIHPQPCRTIGLITVQEQFLSPAASEMKRVILEYVKSFDL